MYGAVRGLRPVKQPIKIWDETIRPKKSSPENLKRGQGSVAWLRAAPERSWLMGCCLLDERRASACGQAGASFDGRIVD